MVNYRIYDVWQLNLCSPQQPTYYWIRGPYFEGIHRVLQRQGLYYAGLVSVVMSSWGNVLSVYKSVTRDIQKGSYVNSVMTYEAY